MSHSGSDFYKPFIFVLGALLLLTLFLVFTANLLSPDSPEDPLALAETKKSIAPVGRSRVVEVAEPVKPAASTDASADASADASVDASTETQTNAVTAEASDTQASEENTAEVKAEPVASATAATAAAGATASASGTAPASMKVVAAVATNCAGCHNDGLDGAAKSDDAAAWSALADKGIDELTASVINGKGKMPARAESNLNDAEIRQAVELMIVKATGAAPAANSAATAATATATATAAPAGEVPAAVKQVVDGACAACHIAGVANAPKFGDKEAWAPRLEKGVDALVASAIAGIGVMPPRGGSTLDDDQMRLAVEYMLSK